MPKSLLGEALFRSIEDTFRLPIIIVIIIIIIIISPWAVELAHK
jgi:hypothetical protein